MKSMVEGGPTYVGDGNSEEDENSEGNVSSGENVGFREDGGNRVF